MGILTAVAWCFACLAAEQVQTADSVALTFADGVVVRLENRLTGEVVQAPARPDRCGLWIKEGSNRFAWHSGPESAAGTTLTSVGTDGAAVTVHQEARTERPGLRGVEWGLTLPATVAVLVPGHSGLRYDRNAPDGTMRFDYPIAWECQFVLIETAKGGFLIHATDDLEHFKSLHLIKAGDRLTLGFESQAPAPWEEATRVSGTTWRIVGYRGDWTVGAGIYRDWATSTFKPVALSEQQPSWVGDIALVVISNLSPPLLTELARRFEPARTLVYVPSWRVAPYDRNYPDYTPAEGVVDQIRAAHEMGFRVMLHVNYFGVTPENPTYESMRPYHVRSPWSGELLYWDWTRARPPIKFAYINPAAKAWRELFTAKMVELVERTGADALHLDQTLCIWNDANGRIDGANMMQGNLLLHQQLRAALPTVALSGEGLNEVTYRLEAFAQRHLWGLNHADGTFDSELIALAHPVSSAVLRPYVGIYGYLGMASPQSRELYLAWRAGYEKFGVLPTLSHATPALVSSGDSLVEQIFRRASLLAQRRLQPLFADYGPDTLFAWRAADGERIEWRRDDRGAALVTAAGEEIARRYHGVSEIRTNESLSGSIAYDAERIFGLDPRSSYVLSPTPRDLAAPHVEATSRPVIIHGRLDPNGPGVVSVAESDPGRLVYRLAKEVHCGVRLRDGTVWETAGLGMQHPTGGSVARRSDGLFAHPPWKGEGVGPAAGEGIDGLGHTFIRLGLDLPAQPCRFRSRVGVDERATAEQCDGVTFRVTASADGDTATASVHAPYGPPALLELDLAAFRGRRIELLLETTPGPQGEPSFDWAIWRDPRLVPATPDDVTLTFRSARPWALAMGDGGPLPLAAAGEGQWTLTMPAPSRVVLLREGPREVTAGLDLTTIPFAVVVANPAGEPIEPSQHAQMGVARSAVGGVERPGFGAHPPFRGTTTGCFALRLPDIPLRLTGAYGVRDGNQSQGVGFRIAVNGEEVWRADVPGGPGEWQPFSVDLSSYSGQVVLLCLTVDSLETYDYDWAAWAEPRFEPAG